MSTARSPTPLQQAETREDFAIEAVLEKGGETHAVFTLFEDGHVEAENDDKASFGYDIDEELMDEIVDPVVGRVEGPGSVYATASAGREDLTFRVNPRYIGPDDYPEENSASWDRFTISSYGDVARSLGILVGEAPGMEPEDPGAAAGQVITDDYRAGLREIVETSLEAAYDEAR